MAEKLVPVQYHLEIYMNLQGDPYFSAKSSTPFATINVGDYLDYRSFGQLPVTMGKGASLRVSEVEHIIWEIEGSHIGHKVMIATDVVSTRD